MYNEKIGVATFIASFVGFNILYFPYFFLMDMPRRIFTYSVSSGLAPLNLDATIGAYIFGPAFLLAILNLVFSLRKKPMSDSNPWEAKEMEWTGNYSGNSSPDSASPEKPINTVEATKNV